MSKYKKAILRIAAVFLTVLLICTFVSKSVYNSSLPKVIVETPRQDVIVYSENLIGSVEFGGVTEIISSGVWKIQEVLCSEGESVFPDKPLFRVDMTDYNIQMFQLEHRLENIGSQIEKAYRKADKDELNYERELVLMQIGKLKSEYPEEGLVRADIYGSIDKLNIKAGRTCYSADVLAEIIPKGTAAKIHWYMSGEQAEHFDDKISVIFNYNEKPVSLNSIYKRWDMNRQLYEYTAFSDIRDAAMNGASLPIEVIRTTERYRCVIPSSAVFGDKYIYIVEEREGLFGVEDRVVEMEVEVAENNGAYAAIDSMWLDKDVRVIVRQSKAIMQGDTVFVVNDVG